MNSALRTSSVIVLCLAASLFAQEKKQRDLKYEEANVPKTPASTTVPRSYAVVIGVANYKNLPAKAQLDFPERDAEAVYSILISPEGGNFRAENVHRLIGPKATLANIRQELETWLPAVTKDDDRVLIYFAGHGFVNNERAYLAPYDITPDNIQDSGYPMDTLGSVIGTKIKGKWKVLLTDSCHSGAITPEADAQKINKSLLDLNKSLFSLTASRDRERSFESKDWGGGHGIFTYYVVKGMEGEADENKDGIVTADELAEYVRRNVREVTKGQQNPTSDRGSFDSNMLLSFLPNGLRSGKPPAPKNGTLIFESNMDGVEVFLDGNSMGVVDKGTPLKLPGLLPGAHTVKAVKLGYEPDGPRDEMVYPGQDATVSIKIMIPRRRNKAAIDLFDKGLEQYNKGGAANYKLAVDNFSKALQTDPTYSHAALYLGRAYNSLFDEENSLKAFRKAIEVDPDYMEARTSLGGMLLDTGAVDEAIRQFNIVTQREPKNAMAFYLQAQAYRMKGLYPDAIESAKKAIGLTPTVGEPHLWLAESLRQQGNYQTSMNEYVQYLKLSDFDSKLAGKLNYYVVGFLAGMGRKKRAAQADTWKDMRNLAYFGLCDCEYLLNNFDSAIPYCQKALVYDKTDPFAHYRLALAYMKEAKQTGSLETLAAAGNHFRAVLEINPDLEQAGPSRQNLKAIDGMLKTP